MRQGPPLEGALKGFKEDKWVLDNYDEDSEMALKAMRGTHSG